MSVKRTKDQRLTETIRVYQTMKRDILAGAFRPGESLQEIKLASRYGASRTPIREALLRLEADGLLTIQPRRGAFVHQPTARDFLEVNELRLILEPYAARLAAAVMSEVVSQELVETLATIGTERPTERDFESLYELDRRMHSAIADSTGNGHMARFIQHLNDMMQIVREQDMRHRHREMCSSIHVILNAIVVRDADGAESAMRGHISDFSGALVRLVTEVGNETHAQHRVEVEH